MLSYTGSNLEAITTCELCKKKLHLNIENFDINELYRSHERVSVSNQYVYNKAHCIDYLLFLRSEHTCQFIYNLCGYGFKESPRNKNYYMELRPVHTKKQHF